MPYATLDELPDAVKQLPVAKQEQWLVAFNTSFTGIMKSGVSADDCEGLAAHNAWDAVRKELVEAPEGVRKEAPVSRVIKIADRLLEKGLIYGVVYEPGVVDAHGDYAFAEDIEKAAHDFLPEAVMNIHHKDDIEDVQVVESYIAPCDFRQGDQLIKKGSWVLVTRILNEELKKGILSGDINAYSLEGTATMLEF